MMKNTIKLILNLSNPNSNIINATIIERNGEKCEEKIEGTFDVGNHLAVVRDVVHGMVMPINNKVITITIEE